AATLRDTSAPADAGYNPAVAGGQGPLRLKPLAGRPSRRTNSSRPLAPGIRPAQRTIRPVERTVSGWRRPDRPRLCSLGHRPDERAPTDCAPVRRTLGRRGRPPLAPCPWPRPTHVA